MNDEQVQLMLIRGAIAGMSLQDRQGVERAALELREVVNKHNDHGLLALALVGAEKTAEA